MFGGDSARHIQDNDNKQGIATRFKHETGLCIHCGAWKGQHGLEFNYMLYVAHAKLWMQEAIRVLKDEGIILLNLGDSYTSSPQPNVKPKSRLLIPERVAIMAVDELGLILRNHIVWYKPNGMPESVNDRFTRKWESIFMFTKSRRYYFDLDAVKIPSKTYEYDKRCSAFQRAREKGYNCKIDNMDMPNRAKMVKGRTTKIDAVDAECYSSPRARYHREKANTGENNKESYRNNNPHRIRLVDNELEELGTAQPYCNPGDVFVVNTSPSPDKHYAMWPTELVKRMILCSTKAGDVVLDPFCGSGTTLKVAEELGRIGCGLDLGYQDVQQRRLLEIQKTLFV